MVIATPNDRIDTQLHHAVAAYSAGDWPDAEEKCRRILFRDPGNSQALALIGYIELSQGRYTEALSVYEELCRQQPREAVYWMNFGNALRGTNSPDDALKAFAHAAELGIPKSADFYFNVGLAHMRRDDFEAARAVFEEALRLTPSDVDVRHQYVLACYECMQFDLVQKALRNWAPPPHTAPEIVTSMAQILMNVGEYSRAEHFLQSYMSEPVNASTLLMLVQIRERANRLTEARELLERVSARPDAGTLGGELHRVAARLAQRESRHELAVELYRRALLDYSEEYEQHSILFPLASSLHALGKAHETMGTLIEAHRSHMAFARRSRPLLTVRGTPQMRITEFPCDPTDVDKWDRTGAPSRAASPIFVVAFPRSGTTLLELTLDSHPLLRSMDEQPFLQNIVEDILARGVQYPEELSQLTAPQLDEIRANYWERVGRKVQLSSGQRLIDKNPLNILRLPAIARVFPNAPILLAIRHPYDVILSCYMQHFRATDFAMICADMPSLAMGYRKTFDFWYEQAELLKPDYIEVQYESLVADFPLHAQRLADFLGLPWDPAMLKPGERAKVKAYISTPSYSQVVQPINNRSVGRWQGYRDYLKPAYPIVEPYLKRWNYES